MATFTNQATLSYNGRLTNSNITTGELLDAVSMTKTAISTSYGENDSVVYAINIVNTGNTPINNVIVNDNLGAYTVGTLPTTTTVYPLDYVDGSAKLFINGILSTAPAATAGPPLVFSGFNIPTGANATLIYEATPNSFAPIGQTDSITNTATLTADGVTAITDAATLPAGVGADLTITKALSPAVVTDNNELTYTFIIQNTGNAEVAGDDVIVTDTFNPILNPITVTYNGTAWAEGTNYTYDETTGEFATLPGQITVPAATYTQDPTTGVITRSPGVVVISVTGTV